MQQTPQQATPPPVIVWTTATVITTPAEAATAAETGTSSGTASKGKKEAPATASIDALESAKEGKDVIVMFVFTQNDDKKFNAARAASENFDKNVLQTMEVATELSRGVKAIKVEYTELTPEAKKQYGLPSTVPQLVVMDYSGKVLYRLSGSSTPKEVADAIKNAKAWVVKLIAKEEAQAKAQAAKDAQKK